MNRIPKKLNIKSHHRVKSDMGTTFMEPISKIDQNTDKKPLLFK